MSILYNSKTLVEHTQSPALKRGIGVIVYDYIANHAGLSNQPAVNIEVEVPSLGTRSSGGYVRVEHLPDKMREYHQLALAEIEAVIAELQTHKAKIKDTLETLDTQVTQCLADLEAER